MRGTPTRRCSRRRECGSVMKRSRLRTCARRRRPRQSVLARRVCDDLGSVEMWRARNHEGWVHAHVYGRSNCVLTRSTRLYRLEAARSAITSASYRSLVVTGTMQGRLLMYVAELRTKLFSYPMHRAKRVHSSWTGISMTSTVIP